MLFRGCAMLKTLLRTTCIYSSWYINSLVPWICVFFLPPGPWSFAHMHSNSGSELPRSRVLNLKSPINTSPPSVAYMRQRIESALFEIMTCRLYLTPNHHLNQCWVIVNGTVRNKHQWNFNQNKKKIIHEIKDLTILATIGMCPSNTWLQWAISRL